MGSKSRTVAIGKIAKMITETPRGRPLRVAVNGRIASGKTMLAHELANEIRKIGRQVLHIGVDGFHNPKSIRYRQGRASAKGYYEDAFNLDALRSLLLEPLGKTQADETEGWLVRTVSFDLEKDRPIEMPMERVTADTIVIVDGSFLLVPKLLEFWDYKIFLNVNRDTATERGAHRDSSQFDGIEEARRMHDERYQAACDLYIVANQPQKVANVVVENDELEFPRLNFREVESSDIDTPAPVVVSGRTS